MITSYCRWWRTLNRSPKTLENYRYTLERLAVRLGSPDGGDYDTKLDRHLRTATIDDLRGYLGDRLEATSPGTAAVDFRAMRSFYAWLVAEGEIDVNPALRLRTPKVPETPVRVATEVVYRRLLAACPKATTAGRRDAAIFAVLWASGVRRGELAALDVSHVDLDERVLTLPLTKSGRPRRVPLDDTAAAVIDRWLRRRGFEPGPLFLAERGGRLTSNGIGQMIERRRDAAGVAVAEVSAHAFRRALSERWMLAGGNETTLRTIQGWSDASPMPGRYTRMAKEQLAHAEYRRLLG
jgi:integrase